MDAGHFKITGDVHHALHLVAASEACGVWPRAVDLVNDSALRATLVVGWCPIAMGTAYTLLSRLVKAGLLERHSVDGERRTRYRITTAGREKLASLDKQKEAVCKTK